MNLATRNLLLWQSRIQSQAQAPIQDPVPTIITNGLTRHYDFLQGTDAQILYDKSGNGFNMQLGYNPTADTYDPSYVPAGMDFGGNDCCRLTTGAPTFSKEYTICLAMMSTDLTKAQIPSMLYSTGALHYLYWHTSQYFNFYIRTASNNLYVSTPANQIKANEWFFLVGRFNGNAASNRIQVKVNSNAWASNAGLAEAMSAPTKCFVGSDGQNTSYVKGSMGCMAEYNVALTDAQIDTIHDVFKAVMLERGITLP